MSNPYALTAIVCQELGPLDDGSVTYSVAEGDPLVFGTRATYSCDMGYSLMGEEIRTCGGNGSSVVGEWNGTEPTCLGNNELRCQFLGSM